MTSTTRDLVNKTKKPKQPTNLPSSNVHSGSAGKIVPGAACVKACAWDRRQVEHGRFASLCQLVSDMRFLRDFSIPFLFRTISKGFRCDEAKHLQVFFCDTENRYHSIVEHLRETEVPTWWQAWQ